MLDPGSTFIRKWPVARCATDETREIWFHRPRGPVTSFIQCTTATSLPSRQRVAASDFTTQSPPMPDLHTCLAGPAVLGSAAEVDALLGDLFDLMSRGVDQLV
jgi:hypothetical protein